MISEITATMVADEWRACYSRDRIDELFPVARTPIEVLTLTDGSWDNVSEEDRFWVVLREDVLPVELMRMFACWCAEQVLPIYEKAHPGDSRPRDAINAARGFARGEVDAAAWAAARDAARAAARDAARAAARDAAWAAARAAARDAAWAAAWAAARDAAWAAARDAAWAAARAAAWAAAWAAAREQQLKKLAEMVRVWRETGDVFGGEG